MRRSLVLTLFLVVVACRSDSGNPNPGNGPDSGQSGPDAPGGMATSIKTIRMNQPTDGTMVSLQNVVVTGHVTSKKYGHVWVQDAGGGQYSGIELYCNYGGTTPNCTMTQAQIDALTNGAVVNVTGAFKSFLLSTAPAGAQPNFEIDSPTITATGQMMTPATVSVDAATIAKAQLASPAADPYKGAYVKVTGPFTVSSVAANEFTAACTGSNGSAGTTFSGFEATGGGQTLAVGLSFYKTMTFCLPDCGYTCSNQVTANESFSTVSGIVEPEYNANGQVYLQISPTTDGDLPH
jgi:hypothetical protein